MVSPEIFILVVESNGCKIASMEQKEFLAKLDCDLYQGYFFSKPLLKDDFEKLIMQ